MSKMWKVLKNVLGSAKGAGEPVVEAAVNAPVVPQVVEATLASVNSSSAVKTSIESESTSSAPIEHLAVSAANNINSNRDDRGSFTAAALDFSLLKSVAPHVPLIRFGRRLEGQDIQPTFNTTSQQQLNISGSDSGSREWWEVPTRYRRQEISELECDVINGGGAGQAWQ